MKGKLKGLVFFWICVGMISLGVNATVYADSEASEQESIWDDDYDEDFSELDSKSFEYTGMSFYELLSYIKTGDIEGLVAYLLSGLAENITYEIKNSNKYILQLLAVIILGQVFSSLSGKFGKMVSGNGFFVTYLMASGILLGIFTLVYDIAENTILDISNLMLTFIPAYTLAVSYTTGVGTAEFTYEITIFIIYLCEKILCNVVFPIVKCSGIIGLVNKMNEEDYFSKTVALLRNIAGFLIKAMLGFVTGFNIIKGIMASAIDGIERNAALKAFSMLPGGSSVKNISDIILGAGLLLKNAIGMVGAILVIAVSLLPTVKIAVIYMALRVLAAVVQPLGDKRFSDGVNIMAKTTSLILKGMWCSSVMFIISLTLMTILAK